MGLKISIKNLWRMLRSVRIFVYLVSLMKRLRYLFLSKFLSSLVKVQPGIGDFVSENYFWLKFNTFHDLTSNFLTFSTVNPLFLHTEILYLSQCQFFFSSFTNCYFGQNPSILFFLHAMCPLNSFSTSDLYF